MQRPLSSFDIYVIVSELQDIVGSYLDKIYQLSENEVLIRFRHVDTKNKESIFIRTGQLLCVTDRRVKTPQKPTTFAMTMRKYLQNGRISGVEQHEFDRVIKLKIRKKHGEYTVMIEFLSDGNIILVDPDEKIILPFIKQFWSHRTIKGQKTYTPPPSQLNPFEVDKEKFVEVLKESDADLVRTLAVSFNMGGAVAEEICTRADVDKNIKVEDIGQDVIDKTYESFQKFLDKFEKKEFSPVLVKENNNVVDVLPFEFKSYEKVEFEESESFTRSLQHFIETKEPKKERKESKKSKKDELISKLRHRLKQQKKKVEELKGKIDQKKREGELIYLHYQKIKKLLKAVEKVLDLKDKNEGIDKINNLDFVKKFDPRENLLLIELNDTSNDFYDVKLDFRKSVSKNAEKAYNESKKMKSKLRGAKKSIDKTLEEIKKAEKEKAIEEKKKEKERKEFFAKKKKRKNFWFEKYRWFISSDRNVVVGGRDAKTNDEVVKKYLKEGDRYVHADISGAPSIVVKKRDIDNKEIEISEETLKESCVFAASYSKAWKQFAEAEAYWVHPEQVSKSPQSGEFVPRGAFIIRGKRNYHKCKLEVAIGKIMVGGVEKVMGGPVAALKKHSDRYVVLEPGNVKKSDVANKIADVFDEDVEDISRVMPPGGCVIVDSEGVKL
ncbi:MAG: ribosome rescue protein RqcH [Candidatus Thermoplasmatota archaeon]